MKASLALNLFVDERNLCAMSPWVQSAAWFSIGVLLLFGSANSSFVGDFAVEPRSSSDISANERCRCGRQTLGSLRTPRRESKNSISIYHPSSAEGKLHTQTTTVRGDSVATL
ncbi:unnamed protein product [Pleuronectes platessa]|uniref:Uncharacterized protein n=1 Tax=Pleuronectes platessa TaxID=8262 RepID=A0A9N7U9V5_PLEPL|nr:unnamed protein product [Pleuronectes platessa]